MCIYIYRERERERDRCLCMSISLKKNNTKTRKHNKSIAQEKFPDIKDNLKLHTQTASLKSKWQDILLSNLSNYEMLRKKKKKILWVFKYKEQDIIN